MWRLRSEWKSVKIGARFHKLTVIGAQFRYHAEYGRSRWMVMVSCDCGEHYLIRPSGLYEAKACRHARQGRRKDWHLYSMWCSLKQRCDNQNQENYERYGGRGIGYCTEWKQFEPFMEWALSHGYRKDLQIDRIDNYGNYESGNCRFVTAKENCRNRRSSSLVTAWGETKTVQDWSEDDRCRVNYKALWKRLFGKTKRTWTPEDAITIPSTPRHLLRCISN